MRMKVQIPFRVLFICYYSPSKIVQNAAAIDLLGVDLINDNRWITDLVLPDYKVPNGVLNPVMIVDLDVDSYRLAAVTIKSVFIKKKKITSSCKIMYRR